MNSQYNIAQLAFSEVIKIKDGTFYNLPYHQARIKHTCQYFFGAGADTLFLDKLFGYNIPSGLVKCRIVYATKILNIQFSSYSFKPINTMGIAYDNSISYPYKFLDRSRIDNLLLNSHCDEIIIVKNGYITDTSTANIVIEKDATFYTPNTYLLPGTKRESLLKKGIISEKKITLEDLKTAKKIYLINAMIDLEDDISIQPNSLITDF